MSGKLEPILETDAAPSAMVKRRVVDEAGSSGDGPEIPPAEAAAAARMDEHVPSGADAAPVAEAVVAEAAEEAAAEAAAEAAPVDSSVSVASSVVGDSALMKIVGPGLASLADKFKYVEADGPDTPKNAAADFIKKLNDYVIKLGEKPAASGGSRRALKRIMKKYSRRVSRSRRQRGKRVKQSAQ